MKREIIALLFGIICLNISAQTRGDLEAVLGLNVNVGKQWAVFIAIDKYNEWQKLDHPVKDAREIQEILKINYIVDEWRELYDEKASSEGIRTLLTQLRYEVGENDSVFVFHAGHGYKDETTDKGAWLPFDAGRNPFRKEGWLPHDEIRTYLDRLPARHVFLISDSCYSGDLLAKSRSATIPRFDNEYFRSAYNIESRLIITSGASQVVPDESEFAYRLKNALIGAKEVCIDPLRLFDQVRDVQQTKPEFGYMPNSRHKQGGSFLFFKKNEILILSMPDGQIPPQEKPDHENKQVSSHSISISFSGDALSLRDQQIIKFGVHDALQKWKTDMHLEEELNTYNKLNITVYREQNVNKTRIIVYATITFSRGGREYCRTGPYRIVETSDNFIARSIVENLISDQLFFKKLMMQ